MNFQTCGLQALPNLIELGKEKDLGKNMMNTEKIKVAILDDHLPIIDGYLARLDKEPKVEVVATASFGSELDPMLKSHKIDVLLLDAEVPNDAKKTTYLAIQTKIPELISMYPNLHILVISMHSQRMVVKNLLDAGVRGYLLKDDYEKIKELGDVVISVYEGGMPISEKLLARLKKKYAQIKMPQLTQRELEILSVFIRKPGITTADAAQDLGVSNSTLRNALSKIYLKLDVSNLRGGIHKVTQLGLLPKFKDIDIA